ncbi:hypothetical protein [Flavobacterium denitrificans]|uniref:hypothetical protein n=1 Tax=Flavobacterium denitrificans TaxID=281361 RepID=UPI0004132A04|nr:hypothetical protein [Flavobacterium denitrificans]
MTELEMFLSSEQPTTCPTCGNRTEILEEFEFSQKHKCLNTECSFKFILEFDNNNNNT